jgi:transcription-repair coupling factor (superfamily II helicase)
MKQIFNKFDNDLCITGLTKELKAKYVFEFFANKKESVILVENNYSQANLMYDYLKKYTDKVLFFPEDEFIASRSIAISPELRNERIQTMIKLLDDKDYIIVTNLIGHLKYLIDKDEFKNKTINIKVNNEISIKKIIDNLYDLGYTSETIVNKNGEFAIRGFVLDVFPINEDNPIRIEFWGDTVADIKVFDVNNQLSIKKIDELSIFPVSDYELGDKISNISNYRKNSYIIYDEYEQILANYNNLIEDVKEYNKQEGKEEKYFWEINEIADKKRLFISSFDEQNYGKNLYKNRSQEIDNFTSDFEAIERQLKVYIKDGYQVVICLSNKFKVNKVLEYLKDSAIFTDENNFLDSKINIIVENISEGYIIDKLMVISEKELFNKKDYQQTHKPSLKMGKKIRDITKIEHGDYVVHYVHGIGIYRGITTINKNGLKKDYLQIDYKGTDKLYIPVEKIELINKYSNSDGAIPPINKLGSIEWQRTKERANKRAGDIAEELLKLYAEREMSLGFSFDKDTEEQYYFEKEFPFEETSDQIRVVEEVKSDMERSAPMDRLICGDVGFGKTEVAFRAMFKAIMSSKQVIMLCPTTILSRQHYLNAIERFKSFPVRIELLNRFTSASNQKKIIEDLYKGKVDIVIGTHRVLSSDIKPKNLGLLVVDEEQRFGVKHKERIKQIKANIDVLTLSATPIPRTIQMSLAGIKNLSLIETPPTNRHPVQTYVMAESKLVIKDSINKELSRGGQVFVLNNKIELMREKIDEIKELVPNARIAYAHGKMSKKELEDVMIKFTNREYDVLITTTIIETGIDIPSANTLIILDADHFGLSQLYQIRGRVGRSNKIAYCYLMYNKNKVLSDIAVKRLRAIKEFVELGSGFAIAMRDLSLRGAGDILGKEQAGFVDTVGIEMFTKMLKNQILKLKGEEVIDEYSDDNPIIDIKTNISSDYISNEELKIEIHKKINSIRTIEDLSLVKNELEDRFGKLDEDLIVYMHQELVEEYSRKLGIKNINQNSRNIEIILDKEKTKKINGEKLFVNLIKVSNKISFEHKFNRLHIILNLNGLDKHFVYYLIKVFNVIETSLV